jgi:hypothetical protein
MSTPARLMHSATEQGGQDSGSSAVWSMTSLQGSQMGYCLRWEYYLEIQAKDVPLTSELIVNLTLRNDAMHARLLGRLK